MGEPGPGRVPCDLEHPGSELLPPLGPGGKAGEGGKKLLHPLQLQGRTKKAGKELPLPDKPAEGTVRQRPAVHILLQRLLVPQGGLLPKAVLPVVGQVQDRPAQSSAEGLEELFPVHPGLVHLVKEEESGHPVALQQPPQGEGVALGPVGGGDHQQGAVQHPQHPLRLGGKVSVARGVHQGELQVLQREHRLLGKDGDAPLPLQGLGVQKGIGVVHPPQLPQGAAGIEEGLGQGGLARIHMGQDAQGQLVHPVTPL